MFTFNPFSPCWKIPGQNPSFRFTLEMQQYIDICITIYLDMLDYSYNPGTSMISLLLQKSKLSLYSCLYRLSIAFIFMAFFLR